MSEIELTGLQTCITDFIPEHYLLEYNEEDEEGDDIVKNQLNAFQQPNVTICQPSIRTWEFLSQEDVNELLTLDGIEIKDKIDMKIKNEQLKGVAREIYITLMYNVTKFCKKSEFDDEKSGAVLSSFHLSHIYLTSNFMMPLNKIYIYFKDLLLCHCLPFAPSSIKILSHKETKAVLELFCKLYLRNLPLIRMLALPNFGLYLYYHKAEEIPLKTKKDKKGKKQGKKGKKK